MRNGVRRRPLDPIAWTASGIPPAGAHVADGERFPWALERIRLGDVLAFSTLDEIPSEIDRASHRAMGTKSAVTIPLSVAGRVVGALGVHAVREERSWPPEVLDRLKVIAGVYDQVIARLQRDEAVRAATQEVQRFRDELQAENVYLKREERERLGLDPRRRAERGRAPRAGTDSAGRADRRHRAAARRDRHRQGAVRDAIHELSARRARPMVRVNCAAIPATLIESELFGREKGAFTGALARQVGPVRAGRPLHDLSRRNRRPAARRAGEAAARAGGAEDRAAGQPAADRRRHAHHRRDPPQSRAAGRGGRVPRGPLLPAERVPDPGAAAARARRGHPAAGLALRRRVLARRSASASTRSTGDNLAALQRYSWPGNIRELRNVVERAMIVATTRRLTIPLAAARPRRAARRSPKLVDVEKEHIRAVLESTGWRIRGDGRGGRSARPEADDARDPDGQARSQTSGIGLNRPPACRAASVMPGDVCRARPVHVRAGPAKMLIR